MPSYLLYLGRDGLLHVVDCNAVVWCPRVPVVAAEAPWAPQMLLDGLLLSTKRTKGMLSGSNNHRYYWGGWAQCETNKAVRADVLLPVDIGRCSGIANTSCYLIMCAIKRR